MKYFTWDMDRDVQRNGFTEANYRHFKKSCRLYAQALRKLQRHFSKRTYRFFSTTSLHDAIVVSFGLENDKRAYMYPRKGRKDPILKPANFQIIVRNGREDRLHQLRYKGVISLDIRPPEADSGFIGTNHLQLDYWWLNDEISLPRRGAMCHEILFHSGAIWRIECKEITVTSRAFAP